MLHVIAFVCGACFASSIILASYGYNISSNCFAVISLLCFWAILHIGGAV